MTWEVKQGFNKSFRVRPKYRSNSNSDDGYEEQEEDSNSEEYDNAAEVLDELCERIGQKKKRIMFAVNVEDISLDAIDALEMASEVLYGLSGLQEDLRKCKASMLSQEARVGFNMAVAIMNKHLGGIL